jgi:hypothetical protein
MLLCVRTTIELNDEVLRAAKRRAADEGTTLKEIIERALRLHLQGAPRKRPFTLKWKVVKGRVRPGVRLDDRDALFDLMDGRG